MVGLEFWHGGATGAFLSVILLQLFDGGKAMTITTAVWGLVCMILLGLLAIGAI